MKPAPNPNKRSGATFDEARNSRPKRGSCWCGLPIAGRVYVEVREAIPEGSGSMVISTSRSLCEKHALEWFRTYAEGLSAWSGDV